MFINNTVSFGMVLFCKCVREFGKVWAFARAEFGMGGTGICPSPEALTSTRNNIPALQRPYNENRNQIIRLFHIVLFPPFRVQIR